MTRTASPFAFALAFAIMAAPVLAVPAAAQNSAQPAPSAAAQQFSKLYMPAELSIEGAVEGFNKEFFPAISADPNVAALDKAKPGLIAAAGKAARDTMITAMQRDIPAAQQAIASFASASFSPAELGEINAFMASATGQRVQKLALAEVDTAAIAQEAKEAGDMPALDGAKLMAMVNPNFLAKLSKEEIADLMRFGATPAGRKFDTQVSQLSELVASEMNKIVEAMKPELEKAIIGAFSSHLGQN